MLAKKNNADRFYDDFSVFKDKPFHDAEKILEIVTRYVQPSSVVDVGCAVGHWLKAFKRYRGVEQVLGIDFGVSDDELLIDKDEYLNADLRYPINVDKKYDLAVCLEVAEHLPSWSMYDFFHTLTGLSDVVLFSGAIPLQGGHQHINCRWQSGWAELFRSFGFVPVDVIRPRIWNDPGVYFFYRQNMLFFVRPSGLSRYPVLKQSYLERSGDMMLDVLHPCFFDKDCSFSRCGLRHWGMMLYSTPKLFRNILSGRNKVK